MKQNGYGGANTLTGLVFEGEVDLKTFLSGQNDYKVIEHDVFYKGKLVANIYKKHDFYKYFLKPHGIDWKKHISKQLLPDDSIFVIANNTVFIIECKYQKLLAQLNVEVEYIYLLSDWFKNPKYKDVLDYIHSVRCHYYFGYIPLQKLGLPVPGVD